MGTPFTMGSHRPVLETIIETLKPQSAMEFGMGLYSTPFLWKHIPFVVSIENILEWHNKMQNKLTIDDNHIAIHHDLGDKINAKTKFHQLSPDIKSSCKDFYKGLGQRFGNMDMLFVDHVSGLRVITLNCLYRLFKIIVFHDSQHPGYYYNEFKKRDLSNYRKLRFVSLATHTEILIRKDVLFDLKEFNNILAKYGNNYCREFNKPYRHKLI